ncbi:glycosyltransferase family 39 protein [Methanobacterium subterraneum]|uniref:glycosyltransferase family 39 protein n=1 Tax=Methanobacterium subterraneum TaxID=59277 RepID=UPI00138FB6BE|nr:glycosyltransferase family 39 protein [Methanobacterium subterraneum]
MAGKNIGYYDLVRPPFIPFLTSLIFRFEGLSIWPIMLIDGFIFIFGSIGLFLLLRFRFDNLTSFLGTLLFSTFPIVLTFICSGLTDISSVSITIWAFFFTVLAVKNNSKWFYLSFPLAMISFVTRFASALIIFPVLFYILINLRCIKRKKDILIGMLFSFVILLPVFWFFYVSFGDPFYTFSSFFGTSSRSISELTGMLFFYNPDLLYFVKNMPSFIGPQAIGVVLVIFLGFLVYILKSIFNKNKKSMEKPHNNSFKLLLLKNKLKILFLALSVATLIVSLQGVHYLFSEILLFVSLFLLYNLFNAFKFKDLDLDFFIVSWFMCFLIFHSVYVIKDFRYFIYLAPPLTYILMMGFKWTTSFLGIKIKNRSLTHCLFSGFLVILLILSTYTSLPSMGETNKDLKQLNEDSISISNWLVNYDPNYQTKIIYSDIWPYSGWHLKMNINKMPQFYNNMVIDVGFKNYNLTAQDMMKYNDKLVSDHADYYISRKTGLTLINYKPIKQYGSLTLYQRIV